jgi:probable O-glycosylation ligase (exosortase A-associated)
VFAYDPNAALDDYTQSIKIIALGVVTMLLVNDRMTFMVVTTCLAACILFYGVKGGIFVLMTGGQHIVFGPPDHFMEANNGLGVALLMMLPIAWFLSTEASNRWLRYGWLGAIPLTMLAILGTYSRGAALALGCTIVYWTIASGRKKLGFAMVALAPVALFAVMPDQLMTRLETIVNYEQDPSAMSRIEMWKYGFKVALANPLFGGGFDVFPMFHLYDDFNVDLEFISSGKSAHSIYFEMLGQHGFIGFAIFMLMGLSFFFFCGRVKRTYSSVTIRNFAAAVQISLVGYAAGGAFVNKAMIWPITFQLLGLMTAAATIFAHAQTENESRAAATGSAEVRNKARPGVGRPKLGRRGAPARRMGN